MRGPSCFLPGFALAFAQSYRILGMTHEGSRGALQATAGEACALLSLGRCIRSRLALL